MKLEDEYPGDAAFARFSETCEESWKVFPDQQLLLEKLRGDIGLARAVAYHCAEYSLQWLEQEIPALDNASPLECLGTEAGVRRLRTCLMRIP